MLHPSEQEATHRCGTAHVAPLATGCQFAPQGQEPAWHDVAGTTLTVAILIRNILTVANIGDGLALLDLGAGTVELTVDQRLENNEGAAFACTRTRLSAILAAACMPLPSTGVVLPCRHAPAATAAEMRTGTPPLS